MSQFPSADTIWPPFEGSLAVSLQFNLFQEMFNDSGGSNSDIIKKSCTGFHSSGWVEDLFLVDSQQREF